MLEKGLKLVRPSFSAGSNFKFPENDVHTNTEISIARVHVERVIQRLKIFAILRDQIEYHLLPYVDDIIKVIACVTNLSSPVLAENKF